MRIKMVSKASVNLVLAVGVLLFLVCGIGRSEEPTPIKVGVAYPMAGLFASDGLEMIQPATLAVEDINNEGGICGRPLEIVEADTKEFAPEDLTAAAELLMAAKVDVIVNNYGGEPADVHVFGKYDVPYINWNDSRTAQAAILENPEKYWNVYKLPPNGAAMGPVPFKVVTELIPKDYGYKHPNNKVALLEMETGWCHDISQDIREVLKESGKWELVVDMGHEYGTTEFGPQLINIRKESPAVIFFSTYAPVEAVAFMNQFLEKPTKSLIFVTYAPSVPEFLELLGKEKAEGLLWGSQETLYGTAEQEAYRDRFKARFGREPGSSNVYDVVRCWAAAARRAGNPSEYRAVIKALTSYPYRGLLGTYKINEETHFGEAGADFVPHRFFQIQDGKHKILYLHDRKYLGRGDYKGTFELPPWIK